MTPARGAPARLRSEPRRGWLRRLASAAVRLAPAAVLGLATATLGLGAAPAAAAPPDDERIREILLSRVVHARQAPGAVVGIVTPAGRRVIGVGRLSLDDPRTPDGKTVFEIGSVTKVFTALLLADMARRGEVALDAPVADLLPSEWRVPSHEGRPIRLVDLATQTSGLPTSPSNFKPRDFGNPHADYGLERLGAWLAGYALPQAPGARFEYSNVGVGLLGHALTQRARRAYPALVRERITGPLAMADTDDNGAPAPARPVAGGHSWAMAPVDRWTSPELPASGFLRSTPDDLLTLLEAFTGLRESALAPAMKTMLETRRPGGIRPSTHMGLGWMLAPADEGEIAWHPGRTGGYLSFIGFQARTRTGVVVLANAGAFPAVSDIGLHLLDPRQALAHPRPPRLAPPMRLDAADAKPLTGRYEWLDGLDLEVLHEDGRLFVRAGSPRRFELFPDGEGAFELRDAPARLQFDQGLGGEVRALNLTLWGREYRAWRRADR